MYRSTRGVPLNYFLDAAGPRGLRFVRSSQRFVLWSQARVACQFPCHVDPEEWGRELGVLKPCGSVGEVED